MERNYLPGILWMLGAIICLAVSYGGSEYHLVIAHTGISYGWLALVMGIIKLLNPPED